MAYQMLIQQGDQKAELAVPDEIPFGEMVKAAQEAVKEASNNTKEAKSWASDTLDNIKEWLGNFGQWACVDSAILFIPTRRVDACDLNCVVEITRDVMSQVKIDGFDFNFWEELSDAPFLRRVALGAILASWEKVQMTIRRDGSITLNNDPLYHPVYEDAAILWSRVQR